MAEQCIHLLGYVAPGACKPSEARVANISMSQWIKEDTVINARGMAK